MNPKNLSNFFSKIISSVYLDGVDRVTDAQGKPPSEENNFLLSEDGKKISGLFFDLGKKEKYPFSISDVDGKWFLKY